LFGKWRQNACFSAGVHRLRREAQREELLQIVDYQLLAEDARVQFIDAASPQGKGAVEA
jgi:hypothetical protein